MKLLRLILPLFLVLLFACEENEVCDQSVRSLLVAGFYKYEQDEEQDTSLNNLSVYGIGHEDDSIYSHNNNIQQIALPLNPDSTEVSFVLIMDSISDTLHVIYQHDIIFVSYACGFAPVYDIDTTEITNNAADSLIIKNYNIQPDSEESIKIYL